MAWKPLIPDSHLTKCACILLIATCFCISAGCGEPASTITSTAVEVLYKSGPELTANSSFAYWQQQNPDRNWIKLAEADLNNDNREDMVVVYGIDNGKCEMVVVLDLPDGYQLTETAPAPVEDQTLKIMNFDSKPPNEIYISGRNGNNAGLAFFRVVDNHTLDNLFADNFADCC
jgi:hypothetical protein